jgi:hypothetical protein
MCHHDLGNTSACQNTHSAYATISGRDRAINPKPLADCTVVGANFGPGLFRRSGHINFHGDGNVFLGMQLAGQQQCGCGEQGQHSLFHDGILFYWSGEPCGCHRLADRWSNSYFFLSTCPRSRSGEITSRTFCLSSVISGNRPSSLRDHTR